MAGQALQRPGKRGADGAVQAGAVDRRGQVGGAGVGRVERLEVFDRLQLVGEGVGEDIDCEPTGVELDRVPAVVDGRRDAADQHVALRAERGIGVQAIDHGRDLEGQHAGAPAEDPFAFDAVAVVDAVADSLDVTPQAVGGDQGMAVEGRAGPVDGVVGKALRFGQFGRGDRLRVASAAAACEQHQAQRRRRA